MKDRYYQWLKNVKHWAKHGSICPQSQNVGGKGRWTLSAKSVKPCLQIIIIITIIIIIIIICFKLSLADNIATSDKRTDKIL